MDAKTFTFQENFRAPRIDMGLSLGCTKIRLARAKQTLEQASRVAVDARNGKILAVGNVAMEIQGRESRPVEVVAPLAQGLVVDVDQAARLVKEMMRASRPTLIHAPRVVVARPPGLGRLEEKAIIRAVRRAGASKVHLVDKVLLAAVGSKVDIQQEKARLVIHLGASTFEAAVVCMAGVVARRILRVGGEMLDGLIRDYVRQAHRITLGERAAETIKRELLWAPAAEDAPMPSKELEIAGFGLAQGRPLSVQLTREEISEVAAPVLEEFADQVRLLLGELHPTLVGDVAEQEVVLCGGGASLANLDGYLARQTGLRFVVAEQPELAVVGGLQGLLHDPVLRSRLLSVGQASTGVATSSGSTPASGKQWAAALLLSGALLGVLNVSQPQWVADASRWVDGVVSPALQAAAPEVRHEEVDRILGDEKDRRLKVLGEENSRLRAMVGRLKDRPQPSALGARVIARDPRGWFGFMQLDRGRIDGVKVGSLVTDGKALVGRVDQVTDQRCRVRLLADNGVTVSAKAGKGAGVLRGVGRKELRLSYVDPDRMPKVGQKVFSNGQDEVFPPGLWLGTVERVLPSEDAHTAELAVAPGYRPEQLRELLILRPSR